MRDPYADILLHVHPTSLRHLPMSELNRAAQFAPFAALSGYDGEIREANRLTDGRAGPDESAIMLLEAKLRILQERAGERPLVRVTYFQADARKSGGSYITRTDRVKQLDDCRRVIVFLDRSELPFSDLVAMEGEVFGGIDDRMEVG